jgi:CDP-4-dehydro-6-deoxyglucose reductase
MRASLLCRHPPGHPAYGSGDGACGSCKCKDIEGQVTHGAQLKALSAEEIRRLHPDLRVARSDVVLESRQVTDSAFPIRKMPVRVTSLVRDAQRWWFACSCPPATP